MQNAINPKDDGIAVTLAKPDAEGGGKAKVATFDLNKELVSAIEATSAAAVSSRC